MKRISDLSWRPRLRGLLIVAVLLGLAGCDSAPAPIDSRELPTRLRRPIAVAVVADGRQLVVANRRSGSISIVAVDGGRVLAETIVGKRLADLAVVPEHDLILVADEGADEILAVRRRGQELAVLHRLAVDSSPVNITVAPDQSTAYVACLWARRVVRIDIANPDRLRTISHVDLPYAPREQRILPDGRHLVVADAFGGQFSAVDVESGEAVVTRHWKAHNMRGIGLSANQRDLLVPHQALMSDSPTTANGVHWGTVMMNVVRTVPVSTLFDDSPPQGAFLDYLGTMDEAAGDPTEMVVTRSGRRIVALAGTSEVAISDERGEHFRRIPVGRRPTALALSPGEDVVYVANTFSDSLSVVDIEAAQVTAVYTLGPQPELTAADRGELLFYDANLSSDGWFSCHSCHTDGHSNGLLNDNFGDGSTGAAKRVLALGEVSRTAPWAWNGQVEHLEDQIRKSIETTMRGPERSEEDVANIADYLDTLQAPPSLALARRQLDRDSVARGKQVFEREQCEACHRTPYYTTADVYDVDLEDALGNRDFNPPTLLGVSQRDRLFHDNRAANLRDVFVEHRHGLARSLSEADLSALLRFLQSL